MVWDTNLSTRKTLLSASQKYKDVIVKGLMRFLSTRLPYQSLLCAKPKHAHLVLCWIGLLLCISYYTKDFFDWHMGHWKTYRTVCTTDNIGLNAVLTYVENSSVLVYFFFFNVNKTKVCALLEMHIFTELLKLSHMIMGWFYFSLCWLIYNTTGTHCLHKSEILVWINLIAWVIGNNSQAGGEQGWPWNGISHLCLLH